MTSPIPKGRTLGSDEQLLGLAVAVMYPGEAFTAEPVALADAQALVAAAGQGEDVSERVVALLGRAPLLAEWIAQLDEDDEGRPPHLQPDLVRDYRPAPGDGAPPLWRYTCPRDGIRWYRANVSEPVPSCSVCGQSLVR